MSHETRVDGFFTVPRGTEDVLSGNVLTYIFDREDVVV